jgi:tagaturonate epimerase
MLKLSKYSLGVGDRFAQEAEAQLRACVKAAALGTIVVPVWNKSNREHLIVGSEPASVRAAAEAAVKKLDWNHPWHVDADHIRLDTVDRFVATSDFFTIDVADSIGKPAAAEAVRALVERHPNLIGKIEIPGVEGCFETTKAEIERIANKFLFAVQEAGTIYRHVAKLKGEGNFIAEVSMDETDSPQTPVELLVILVALADEKVPIQTIAPKFTGRFNKGVDYVGNLAQFEKEFGDDISVIAYAVKNYGLPDNLKLSVHSGSDKFSIYAPIRRAIQKHNAGLHLKTAGTTWLEEIIGLAEAGGAGLVMAKQIYAEALKHVDELCAPYAAVIDIDRAKLPSAAAVSQWTSAQYVAALRHDPTNKDFNPSLRQLLHVGYKIAAKKGDAYLELVRSCRATIGRTVTHNLFERHIKPVFLGA